MEYDRIDWMMRRGWGAAFAMLLAFFVYWEAKALLSSGGRDTLTATVRDLLVFGPYRWLFHPFWCWLSYHFFQSRQIPMWSKYDLLAVLGGLATAWLFGRST